MWLESALLTSSFRRGNAYAYLLQTWKPTPNYIYSLIWGLYWGLWATRSFVATYLCVSVVFEENFIPLGNRQIDNLRPPGASAFDLIFNFESFTDRWQQFERASRDLSLFFFQLPKWISNSWSGLLQTDHFGITMFSIGLPCWCFCHITRVNLFHQ